MAIQGLQQINIGLPNESAGSDSLYTAFNKAANNFSNLFANASPVPVAGNGIAVDTTGSTVTLSANLIAGDNIVISNVGSAVRIDAVTGGPSGSITGVLPGTGLTGGGYSGNVTLGLATSGVVAASYTNPTITVDAQGRITSASNNTVAGTVTSVGLLPGTGIGISGGPVTSAGNITVTNTGVTRLSAGTGITVSSSTGNVTISATPPAAVTSVGISSSQLVITGSPIISAGTIAVNLPASANFAGTVNANVITANTGTINGNLTVTGNISPATETKVGGIKAGPGANVSLDGTLTIDTANIPLSFGNFTASNNILQIDSIDQDMVLRTQGNAEIQLVGNIGFYKPDGLPPNIANRYFSATDDGRITILVSDSDPNVAAVNIIGSTSGTEQSPINTGVMLHITGQNADPARLYVDGIGGYAGYIGRRYNGTASSPTQILDGDEIARLGINGYTSTGWLSIGQARISFVSTDNQSDTAQGSKIEFWSTPKGSTVSSRQKTLELDATYGANIIGNVAVTSNITVTGNVFGAGAITTSSGSGVGYRTGAGGTATQNNSKSDPVTLNRITGEITMNGAQLGGDATVSFTLNNTTITNKDVMIINQVSTANAGEYSFNAICNTGNAVISVHNMTNTNRSDAIVLRYAVIKGATS